MRHILCRVLFGRHCWCWCMQNYRQCFRGGSDGPSPLGFSCSKAADIGLRHKTVASVVQMSLLLMNYSRAHFSSNEILNGVLRKSSPLCITELHKVIDLNGNSLLDLMKREKHSQFTQGEVEWETRVKWCKRSWCLLSYVCQIEDHQGKTDLKTHQWDPKGLGHLELNGTENRQWVLFFPHKHMN